MDSSVLCKAIRFDGWSVNAVAKATNIPQSSLQRFCSGDRGLQMESFVKACDLLDLQLMRVVDLDRHIEEKWEEEGRDEAHSEFEVKKEEEWAEHIASAWEEYHGETWPLEKDEQWKVFAEANGIEPNDSNAFREWELDAFERWEEDTYPDWESNEWDEWSIEYDDMHYEEWLENEFKEFKQREAARIKECDWIVLKGEGDE